MMMISTAYDEILPVFRVSSYFGIAPFKKNFKLSFFASALSIIILTVTISLAAVLGVLMEEMNSYQLSAFSLIVERAELFAVSVTIFASVVKALFNSRPMTHVMNVLNRVDKSLREVGVFVEHDTRFCYWVLSIRLFLTSLMLVLDIISKGDVEFGNAVVSYIICIPIYIFTLIQIQFMVIVEAIRMRIQTMSDRLRDLSGKSYYRSQRSLETFIVAESAMIEVCSTVNSMYTVQILAILSSVFIITTANLYHVIEKTLVLLSDKNTDDLSTLLLILYRIIVRSYEVCSFIKTCVDAQDEAKGFNTILYQLLIEDQSEELVSNAKLRLHISMKKDIEFNACGLFALDCTLLHSIIAAATTYLVILIQFSQISETPPKGASSMDSTPMPT